MKFTQVSPGKRIRGGGFDPSPAKRNSALPSRIDNYEMLPTVIASTVSTPLTVLKNRRQSD